MSLTQFRVDDGPHTMDGLRLFAQDRTEQVEAFTLILIADIPGDLDSGAMGP